MVATEAIQLTYQQMLGTFIWYAVEFVYYLSVIAYVLYTFKIIGPYRMKENVPEAVSQTWAQSASFLTNAAQIVKQVNQALEGKPVEEGAPEKETPKAAPPAK